MARGPRYRVAFRRRRNGRTDFRMRRAMILSRKPRLVVRGSLKHISVQVMDALPIGDRTLMSTCSQDLIKGFGWKAYCGNVPAAYLVGFLLGHRTRSLGIDQAILDIGLKRPIKGARIFAALKGVVDAGLNIPHDDSILPHASRIRGEHVVSYAKKLAEENLHLYEKTFSGYLSRNLKPEQLTEHFEEVKKNIEKAFREGK